MFKKLCVLLFALLVTKAYSADSVTFSDKLESHGKVKVSNSVIKTCIESGEFEAIFTLYQDLQQEQAKSVLVDEAYRLTKNNTDKVLPVKAVFVPKGIIVLGAPPELGVLESRLNRTYSLVNQYPDIPVILSGKGRKTGVVEADYMFDYLVKKGIDKKRLFKESLSEDTVGNAVFSYFTIEQDSGLRQVKDWLIVTNNYHAMRALFNFTRVFPQDYRLAVYLAPLLPDGIENAAQDDILKGLVASEISSDSNVQFLSLLKKSWFDSREQTLQSQDITGRPCDIFNEMLFKHRLYKDKFEELRSSFQCISASS